MLDLPLRTAPLVFFDFETTGLYPYRGDRVCEVALLRMRNGAEDLRYTTLIDPERPLSERSFQVNQISAEELNGAPRFAEMAGMLRALCAGSALVAHNALFDSEFLRSELLRAGLPPFDMPVIDTLAIARRLYPRRSSHSLRSLALTLGADPPSHRAMDDVLALRVVFAAMTEQLVEAGVTTLGGLLSYARGFAHGENAPSVDPLIHTALREGRMLRVRYSSRALPEPTERVIRPIELFRQGNTLFLQSYCYFRHDLRAFVANKLEVLELTDEAPSTPDDWTHSSR